MIKEVQDLNFSSEVEDTNGVVLVDFWASWCGPCKMIAPIVEELSGEYDGKVKFVKVNVDDSPEVSKKYRITSIPTLMIFKEGKTAETLVGFRPKQDLKVMLDKHI